MTYTLPKSIRDTIFSGVKDNVAWRRAVELDQAALDGDPYVSVIEIKNNTSNSTYYAAIFDNPYYTSYPNLLVGEYKNYSWSYMDDNIVLYADANTNEILDPGDQLLISANTGWDFGGEPGNHTPGTSSVSANGSVDVYNRFGDLILNIPVSNDISTQSTSDNITGERIIDLSSSASKIAGDDGIIDRFTLQTSAAPANPWRITEFNPTEDILQIPAELASRTAAKSFFGVQKVVMPDRPLTKSEQKSYKKQQKAVSKSVKRIGKTGDGFVYNQLTGELFVDTNGRKKGFGEGGGLLAVLEDTPAIGINNFQFL
jgi:hypothetical protein